MKISMYDPNKETAEFCGILHPATQAPLKDELGVEVGVMVVSSNSRTARQSKAMMRSEILRRKEDFANSLGKPTLESLGPGAKADDLEIAIEKWESDNKDSIKQKHSEITNEEYLNHLARCCTEIVGRMEDDNDQVVTCPSQLMAMEWIAARVNDFHLNLSNWVPKQ